jgi:hypothetical protein
MVMDFYFRKESIIVNVTKISVLAVAGAIAIGGLIASLQPIRADIHIMAISGSQHHISIAASAMG